MAVVSRVCGRLERLDADLCGIMAADLHEIIVKHQFVGVSDLEILRICISLPGEYTSGSPTSAPHLPPNDPPGPPSQVVSGACACLCTLAHLSPALVAPKVYETLVR